MLIDYNVWKDELERFIIEKFGSIDAANDYSLTQKAMDMHMAQFTRRYAGNDPQKVKEAIRINKNYMRAYTKTLNR